MAESDDEGATGPAEPVPSLLALILAQAGNLRDALLIFAGTVYVLGYLLWSYTAWREGLGLLPVIDVQYFAAGTLPGLLLLATLLLLAGLARLSQLLAHYVGPESRVWGGRLHRIVRGAWITVVGFAIAAGIASEYLDEILRVLGLSEASVPLSDLWRNYSWALVAGIGLLFLLILVMPFANYGRQAAILQTWLNVLVLCAVLGALITTGFKELPQEFGGIGARCARLDLESGKVSRATHSLLLPSSDVGAQGRTPPPVVRTRPVQVIFAATDFLIVKVDGRTLELKRTVVNAVIWCDTTAPA